MLLLNSIKSEQLNRTHKNDSITAFWYTAEGPSYIRS